MMDAGADHALLSEVERTAAAAGMDAVGVTDVAPFSESRRALDERKAAGLHAGMWFTYGRPERSTTPSDILPGARSIVVCARSYRPPTTSTGSEPVAGSSGQGVVAAYVANDVYGILRNGLDRICDVLHLNGFSAVPVCDDNRLVDRAAAARAGLGWLGHNTMLLSSELGSWTVLGAVVTTATLPTASDAQVDGCGPCRRCQVACPTGALDTAGVLDANRCLAWLVQAPGAFPHEFRVALGDRLYGCDDCQAVCPYNDLHDQFGGGPEPSASPQVHLGHSGSTRRSVVDVVGMLRTSDEDLMEAFGHWYIPRRQPEYLRRNALVVLGNVGDPEASEVADVLAASLRSASAVVASHAVWAARRLGRSDLVADAQAAGFLADDPDGLVVAELEREVPRRQEAV